MHGNVAGAGNAAITATPAIGSEFGNTLTSGSDRDSWFYNAAQGLLGDKDTGLHLHYLTGYPQSSCYAYVAKNPEKRRPPPEHLLWVIFRSDQGEPWVRAFMAGCTAKWWLGWMDIEQRERKLRALAQSIFSQVGEAMK